MARFAYFFDAPNGEAFALGKVYHDGSASTAARHFIGSDATGVRRNATRAIELKPNPSRHICDSRCVNATGLIMKCECSCGGKNHGRGKFLAEAA